MSIRVRESAGTSWRDPRQPGMRHWRSTSVSYGGGWYALGWLAWYGVVWPFLLLPLWLTAEFWLLAVTGALALGALVTREAKPADITTVRLRWHLLIIGLKGRA